MELLIDNQTSIVQLLKFRNVISDSTHYFLGMWLSVLSMVGLKLIFVNKKDSMTLVAVTVKFFYFSMTKHGPLFFLPLSTSVYSGIHIDGSMRERCNSIANALELHLSCTNLSFGEIHSLSQITSWIHVHSYKQWHERRMHGIEMHESSAWFKIL